MGGKKDKKKKSKDPEKKAALAAKKEAKADKAALKRIQKEKDRLSSLSLHDSDHDDDDGNRRGSSSGGGGKGGGDDLDAILESYRNRTKELSTAEFEVVDTPFPSPPRGNFTWTLCPSNGMFYMVSCVLKLKNRYKILYAYLVSNIRALKILFVICSCQPN